MIYKFYGYIIYKGFGDVKTFRTICKDIFSHAKILAAVHVGISSQYFCYFILFFLFYNSGTVGIQKLYQLLNLLF